MTRCVAFMTPGLIPLDAFTTFGVNAKPATKSPFGYFGTGLKYAISVCLRSGCRIVMWRGDTRFEFFIKRGEFRDRSFDFVRMKRRNVIGVTTYIKLPFTLELGKNWELWQAFRELETNTRDEQGSTALEDWPEDARENSLFGHNATTILVYGDKFVDEFLDMGKHFLEGGKIQREDDDIQIIDRPSKHVYYRSVRIMDLKEESQFTYNFLRTMDLTEDRTAKYPWMLESWIADYWLESEDEERVKKATQGSRWESRSMSYGYASSQPSRVFATVAKDSPNPTIREYLVQKDPSVCTTTTIHLTIPKPEITENELADIVRAVSDVIGMTDIVAKNTSSGDEFNLEEIL